MSVECPFSFRWSFECFPCWWNIQQGWGLDQILQGPYDLTPTTNNHDQQQTPNNQQPTTTTNNQQPTATVAFAPLQPRHIVVGGETSSFIPRAERQDLKELEEYQWGNSTQAVRVCWWRFQSRKLLETGWSGRWRYGGVFFWKASKYARKSSLAGLEMREFLKIFSWIGSATGRDGPSHK